MISAYMCVWWHTLLILVNMLHVNLYNVVVWYQCCVMSLWYEWLRLSLCVIPSPARNNGWWLLSYAAGATSHIARYSCHLAFAGFESKDPYGSATTTCKSFESNADPISTATTNTICYTIVITRDTPTTTTTTNSIAHRNATTTSTNTAPTCTFQV